MLHHTAAQNTAQPLATANLTSYDILPGEQINLIVKVSGLQPAQRPSTPQVKGVAINFVSTVTHIDSQRRLGYAYVFRVTPAKAGNYTIPAIHLSTSKGALQTEPQSFTVHPLSKLTSFPTENTNQTLKAAWFPDKTSLYQGELCRVFLKIYVPNNIRIINWGFPESEKTNCLAWRFSPPSEHDYSTVSLDKITHTVVTYSTTVSGIKPGTASLGPADLTIYQRSTRVDPTRGYVRFDTPIKLTLPAVNFSIKPLPAGAPDDFNGAVGNFEIGAFCQKTSFSETDPTEVLLRVAGTGNLPTIQAPVLTRNDWKIIDTSKVTRGEERRSMNGMITFRQLIRSLPNQALPTHIPPYSFSYFNPEKKIYQTKTTLPIPVSLTPNTTGSATTAPAMENLGTAPEEMRDIISFIDHGNTITPKVKLGTNIYWNLIPAGACLLILLPLIRKKIAQNRSQDPNRQEKNQALQELSKETDTSSFYRRAGKFIEQWLTPNSELEEILKERNTICFTPDGPPQEPISQEKRNHIINLLKRCSKLTLIITLGLLLTPKAFGEVDFVQQAEQAWKSRNYEDAILNYSIAYPDPPNTPADILFNIGNCHHRLAQPGHAALAWRQALANDPTHQQSRQNLRFVEIQNNANVPKYENWQYPLTHFTPKTYQLVFYTALWIIGLTILFIIARRPRGKLLTLSIIVLVTAPIFATLGKVADYNYPDDHQLAHIDQQALILLANAKLYTEAHRQSDSTTLPPASLIKINATRGPWINITTADALTGWVEKKFITKVR